MKGKLTKLFIALLSTVSLGPFLTFEVAADQYPYDESSSVVFDSERAYFKFLDEGVTREIVNNRWAKNINFTEEEKKAMHDYTSSTASTINEALDAAKGDLTKLPQKLGEEVGLLDSATHKMTIPWDMIVYRYVHPQFLLDIGFSEGEYESYYKNNQFDPKILERIKPQTLYTKYSFMSTTALKNGAMTSRPIEIRLRVPRGNHAAFVEPYSAYKWENEFLFSRNGQLEVIGANLTDDKTKLLIEMQFKASD